MATNVTCGGKGFARKRFNKDCFGRYQIIRTLFTEYIEQMRSWFKIYKSSQLCFIIREWNYLRENYTTDVFRAHLRYTGKASTNGHINSTSVIVKCTHEGGLLESLAREINLFDKELDMFSTILPKMNKLHQRLGSFSACCLKYIEKPLQTLLLEDLCPMGYTIHERRFGLDLEHTQAILRILAGFHATSYIMLEEDPNILKDIYESGLFPDKEVCTGWISTGYVAFKDAINRWPEFEKYRDRLTISESVFIRRCLDTMSKKEGDFIVLNHGDMWINNMMFAYSEDGRIKDTKLIDYQLSIKCSPAVDLHYFFSTSLADELRSEIDYLLDYYYGHLLVAFTELGHDLSSIPTREQFLNDFKKRAYYGILGLVTVLPLVRSQNREDASFEDLFFNDKPTGFRYHAFNNEQYKKGVLNILPYYDTLGILE
ncbi:hypothetical protein Trydic_g5558 [Trypoxylus dichotomus]